jgi:hypothetical protein
MSGAKPTARVDPSPMGLDDYSDELGRGDKMQFSNALAEFKTKTKRNLFEFPSRSSASKAQLNGLSLSDSISFSILDKSS